MLGRPFWAIAVTLLNLRSPWLNGDTKSGKKMNLYSDFIRFMFIAKVIKI
jgi:hypothetical protein